jgi:hypothetical protein
MNDETPFRGPAENAAENVARVAVVAALDALEVGDQREATSILLNALEDGVTVHRCRCPFCSWTGEWPGLLDGHIFRAHPYAGEGLIDRAA